MKPSSSMATSKLMELFLHQFILVVIWLPFLCLTLETDTISSTSSVVVRDPDSIVSPKQVFKLGFFSPEKSSHRYLGVFHTLSENTAVWTANRDNPLNDSFSTFSISKDGNLVLINSRNQTVWSTNLPTSSPINTTLQILDTGNLLLRDTATGNIAWQSFSVPSNCFLPTMNVSHNIVTGKKVFTSAWENLSDPQPGSYTGEFEVLRNIPQFFIMKNGRPHWRSGQWNGMFFLGIQSMFDSYLDVFRVVNDHAGTFFFTAPEAKTLMKICVNSSGSLVQSMWSDQNKSWVTAWWAPANECDYYAKCGPFGSCNPKDSPICSCPKGFEPMNRDEWERGNWSGGCQRKNQLQCNSDRLLRLQFMKIPDLAEEVSSTTKDECVSKCSRNCSCIACAYEANLGCLFWTNTLIDMQKFAGVGVDLHVRLSDMDFDNPKDRKLYIIIPVVVGSVSVSIFALAAWCWIARRKGDKTKVGNNIVEAGHMFSPDSDANVFKYESESANIEKLPLFSFETLAIATDQFHEYNLLGRGGFGPVYKGNLENGKEIAVKRLSEASGQGGKEFMNEAILISKLQHRNLVRLLGCCVEKEEKLLVYEYMPNKSLDVCLFDPTHPSQKVLDWAKRFSIIQGIGRGLLYLHRDSRHRIIHRDLKPSNVLLDEDWNPKISDFGMARMFGGNQDHCNTARVVGTYGYMAPEYAMEGRFSEKSDVYSFGVLMLEIVKGKKNTHYYNNEWSLSLIGIAWKLWSEENGLAFADEMIESSNMEREIVRCIQIALLCVQDLAKDRPSIQTVLSMLSTEIVDLPAPDQPVFEEKSTTQPPNNQVGYSINELTLTVLDGR